MPDPAPELVAELERQFRLMNTQSVLFSQAIADKLQMNSSDMESMDFLNVLGPMTPGRLAELTGLSTGGVTRLVDRLVERGWIRREADPNDRRKVILHSRADEYPGVTALWDPMLAGFQNVVRSFTPDQLQVVLDFTTLCTGMAQNCLIRLRDDDSEPDLSAHASQPGNTPV